MDARRTSPIRQAGTGMEVAARSGEMGPKKKRRSATQSDLLVTGRRRQRCAGPTGPHCRIGGIQTWPGLPQRGRVRTMKRIDKIDFGAYCLGAAKRTGELRRRWRLRLLQCDPGDFRSKPHV